MTRGDAQILEDAERLIATWNERAKPNECHSARPRSAGRGARSPR
jgi:hypothetical protein